MEKDMIECTTLYGKKKLISKEKLIFRPAAYAIILNRDKVLIVDTRTTRKYFFPGGGVNIGEKIEDALRREVREEVGIEVEVKKFLYFKESFFYYDPLDEAYHSFSHFFICKPKTFVLKNKDEIDDLEAENPRWIRIDELKPDNIQSFGEVIEVLKNDLSEI